MNILDALDDPKVFAGFFRAGTWGAWRVFLAALFGLPMTDDQLATYRRFAGRSTASWSPAPRRTCPSHPQHPFHKQTIVVSAASRITDLPWQFRYDPFPLGVAQYRANQG
jgi:hypothetical protein